MGDVEGLAGVGRAAGVRWAGEGRQLKGPGKRGSPLVPLRDDAGGPRDLRVVEPQHPRVDPCPRQPWLHQGCPQPVMWGQNTTTCPRRREWVVTTPAVTTVNLERLWGSRRRPISLPVPQASVQPQEKGESQGQRGDVPPAEQEGPQKSGLVPSRGVCWDGAHTQLQTVLLAFQRAFPQALP